MDASLCTLNAKQQFGGGLREQLDMDLLQRSQQASAHTLPQDAEEAGPSPGQMPVTPCPV